MPQNLIVIFGPCAVGKMTVGRSLTALTGIPLFHNHMSIEPVLPFFTFGTPPFNRLVGGFRRRLFEEVAASDLPGLIFTYVWALQLESEKQEIDELTAIFESRGASVGFVELAADRAVRVDRNRSSERLEHKPSKRNVERSERNLHDLDANHVLNTSESMPFCYPDRHLRIDNSALAPADAAAMIQQRFGL
ncbi:MAG: AAA family ATPase [Planctomycetota bacterium]